MFDLAGKHVTCSSCREPTDEGVGEVDRHESQSGHTHHELNKMNLVARKPVFGFSDQVIHKPGCTITEIHRKSLVANKYVLAINTSHTALIYHQAIRLIFFNLVLKSNPRSKNDKVS